MRGQLGNLVYDVTLCAKNRVRIPDDFTLLNLTLRFVRMMSRSTSIRLVPQRQYIRMGESSSVPR